MNATARPAGRTLRCPCTVGRCIAFPDCADCQGTGKLELKEAPTQPSALPNLARLYRAHVQPQRYPGTERTVFVEAGSHSGAHAKIVGAIAALEQRPATDIEDRVYNCHSAQECIEMGVSADLALRLFEIGWGEQTLFVEEPVFLVDQPSALWRKWMQTQNTQEVSTQGNA